MRSHHYSIKKTVTMVKPMLLIASCSLQLLLLSASALEFDLVHRGDSEYDDMKCVSEEHNERAIVLFQFRSVDNVKLSIKLFDPNEKIQKQFEDVVEGDYGFTAKVGGDYKACFYAAQIAEEDRVKHRVSLEWKSGVAATTWGKIAKEADVDLFTKSLRRLEADLIEVHETMLELRKLEADMRDKNEATNSKVLWMGLISLGVCVGLALWQVIYLKKFFQRKKLL
jgi:p24 family protein delta-1